MKNPAKVSVGEQLSLFGLKLTPFQELSPTGALLDIHEITERPKRFTQYRKDS